MVRLEYFNGNEWVLVDDKWHSAELAWSTLGGDTFNYRVVENGKVVKEDTVFDNSQTKQQDNE